MPDYKGRALLYGALISNLKTIYEIHALLKNAMHYALKSLHSKSKWERNLSMK